MADAGEVEVSRFEVVRLAALRVAQLMRGCSPRVAAVGKATTTARREVAEGKVRGLVRDTPVDRAPVHRAR